MTAGLPDRAADRERECTCCPPGKRPVIEHAKGCPRRAPRTVPLSASSVGEQIAALAARPAPDDGEALREALLDAITRCLGLDPAEAEPAEVDDLMGYLLPVVERFAAEQVAAALNDAADVPLKACCPEHASKRIRARARAAAVLAAPRQRQETGMSVRTYRVRRGLKGSATADWIITALARQREPHSFTANPRTGNCAECGLPVAADVHAAGAR